MSARLRPLRAGDLPAVLALERALFPDDPWPPDMFASELAQVGQTRYYLVAEEVPSGEAAVSGGGQAGGDDAAGGGPDGERNVIVGYAGLLMPGGGQAEVLTLAVDPARWGRGTGTALLTALVDEAARNGCAEVFLEVRADNPRAQDLYRRHGFADVGIRRGYYQPSGVDAIVMRRALTRARPAGAGRAGGAR